MGENKNGNQPENSPVDDPINDMSNSDKPIQYTELIQEHVFLGKYPFPPIIEGIKKQFEDYINIEDTTNYVDIFYHQFHNSCNKVKNDIGEEHPNEIKEVLDKIYQSFIDTVQQLFKKELMLSIMELEAGFIDPEDLEFIIRKLYDFFILRARNNFKAVIATDIGPIIANIGDNDKEYFQTINNRLEKYSPLFTTISPTKFLQYCRNQEIHDMYEDGKIAGNFLRKYSPRLYQNEEFQIEIINYITMVAHFQQDVIDSQNE